MLWYSQPYCPSSQTLAVVEELVVPGFAELSVVNSGEELSIWVEKLEVEVLELDQPPQPYCPSSQLDDGAAELSVVNSGDELSMVVPGALVTVETQTSGETVTYEVTVAPGQLAQLVTVTVEAL